MQHDAMNAHAT